MTYRIIPYSDREEWLELRRGYIGGSDAAGVCGLSRWESPMRVYLEKIGALESEPPNEAMYWGTKHEPTIRDRFEEDHPELRVLPGQDCGLLVSEAWPFAAVSVDGLLWSADDLTGPPVAGWEAKTVSAHKRKEWADEALPDEYWLQALHAMAVTGLPRWEFSVLFGGNDYAERTVLRDEPAIASLMKREEEFWRGVESRTPPPVDGSPDSKLLLNFMYPAAAADTEEVALGSEEEARARTWLALKAEASALTTQISEQENLLKSALGAHALGLTPGGLEVSWKPQSRAGGVDAALLSEKYPEVFRECAKPPSEFRRFNVKEVRNGEDG